MQDFENFRQTFLLAVSVSDKLKPAAASGDPHLAASLHAEFGGDLARLKDRLELISEIPTALPAAAAVELKKIARIVKEARSHMTLPDACMILADSDLGPAGMRGLDALTAERNKHLYPWADSGPSEESIVGTNVDHAPTKGRTEPCVLRDELWEALDNCINRLREHPVKVLFETKLDSPGSLDADRINGLAKEVGLCADGTIFVKRERVPPGGSSATD